MREAISLDEQIFKDTVRVIVKLAGWLSILSYTYIRLDACELRSTESLLLHLSSLCSIT